MTLSELLVQLDQANIDLKEAALRTSAARSDETAVRNRVNKLQKEIDAQIVTLKEKAEWDTDWHSLRQKEQRVRT
jgi:hypothetical protein